MTWTPLLNFHFVSMWTSIKVYSQLWSRANAPKCELWVYTHCMYGMKNKPWKSMSISTNPYLHVWIQVNVLKCEYEYILTTSMVSATIDECEYKLILTIMNADECTKMWVWVHTCLLVWYQPLWVPYTKVVIYVMWIV